MEKGELGLSVIQFSLRLEAELLYSLQDATVATLETQTPSSLLFYHPGQLLLSSSAWSVLASLWAHQTCPSFLEVKREFERGVCPGLVRTDWEDTLFPCLHSTGENSVGGHI